MSAAPAVHAAAPGVTVTPTSLQVTEGPPPAGSATYQIALTKAPAAMQDVVIFVTNANLQIEPNVVRLTSANWQAGETITVTAANDDSFTGTRSETISHRAVSADRAYNNIEIENVSVTILEDDLRAALVTDQAAVTVAEGGTAPYALRLSRAPLGLVRVAVSSSDSRVTVSPSSVDFDQNNWQTAKTITLTRANDNLFTGTQAGTISHSVTSTDLNYDGLSDEIAVTIGENDVPRVIISETIVHVTETTVTDTYNVSLNGAPTANVVVSTAVSGSDATATPSLTFTSANWSTPQSVTVTATQDDQNEGSPEYATITHSTASADSLFHAISPISSVSVEITDIDVPGVSIDEDNGVSVNEGGAADTYTIVLTSKPYSNVSVTVTASSEVLISQTGTAGSYVSSFTQTFTPSNWSTAQPVYVQAPNDNVFRGNLTAGTTHTVSSPDGDYNGFNLHAVSISVADNDSAVLTVDETGTPKRTRVTEDGGEDTVLVSVTSEPSSPVTVTVNPGSQLELVSGNTLTFNAANWQTAQTVTFKGKDDDTTEADTHGTVLRVTATAGASEYLNQFKDVSVSVIDNDGLDPALVLSLEAVTVTEGDAPGQYYVKLNQAPTTAVRVRVEPVDDSGAPAPGQVTVNDRPMDVLEFTTANWDTPHYVTVEAVEDFLPEDETTIRLRHTVMSTDSKWQAVPPADVVVTVQDND